jgi:subfamily B ATP-binding cassette protein MsbA
MKELLAFLKRFVRPYRKNLVGSISYNLLSAILNVFSFALIVPILRILFKISTEEYEFIPLSQAEGAKDMLRILKTDFFFQVTGFIDRYGESRTLLILGLTLIVMTLLKTACYFGASAIMVPLRNGVVRDIRVRVYDKILNLPMSFFSKERKGDIITRMSADVSEIENSIAQSLDMLIKNPILIIVYITTLIAISWQMTIFTLVIGPLIIWVMGSIGRKLKASSLVVQSFWSDTMSQLEETLGGLRVIKAFLAEGMMSKRFAKSSDQLRKASNKVHIRQALAHPVSEFMGFKGDIEAGWRMIEVKSVVYTGDRQMPFLDDPEAGMAFHRSDPFYNHTFYNRTGIGITLFSDSNVDFCFRWNMHFTPNSPVHNQQLITVRFNTGTGRKQR